MKKRWKQTAGFTLVELIVVIAILGILAGVAVPTYSGYVKKANMASDESLVNDIENALLLAGYAGTFNEGEGGYVVLSAETPYTSANTGDNTKLDQALKNTFGEGYALQLKHDGWGNNGIMPDAEKAFVVANSSYMTGGRKDVLLSDVEKMTSMAQNLVTSLASGGGVFSDASLSGMFTNSNGVCVLDETAAKYGIDKGNAATWEDWAGQSDANKTAYSNLLVLTAADESEKYMDDPYGYDMTGASDMILEFSSYYAFAATNPEFSATLDTYMDSLSTVTDKDSGMTWYNSLKAEAGAEFDTYLAENEPNGDPRENIDKMGFLGILSGLGNPTEEQAANIAADIYNDNLFTNGVVNNMYNEYLDAVDSVNGLTQQGISVTPSQGEIAVLVKQSNDQLVIFNTLPVG